MATYTAKKIKFQQNGDTYVCDPISKLTKTDITALGIPGQDTTYTDMAGATSQAAGESGLAPAPAAGENVLYLKGDGAWGSPAMSELGLSVVNGKICMTYKKEAN